MGLMAVPQPSSLPYKVRIYDNFHYMDASESWVSGEFSTYEEALAHAQLIVRESCAEFAYDMGQYCLFGDDPAIEGPSDGRPLFSARDYARQICDQHGKPEGSPS